MFERVKPCGEYSKKIFFYPQTKIRPNWNPNDFFIHKRKFVPTRIRTHNLVGAMLSANAAAQPFIGFSTRAPLVAVLTCNLLPVHHHRSTEQYIYWKRRASITWRHRQLYFFSAFGAEGRELNKRRNKAAVVISITSPSSLHRSGDASKTPSRG